MVVLPLAPRPSFPDASFSSSAIPSINQLNINHNINFKFDYQSNNFSKWRQLMRHVLPMYSAKDHIDHYSDHKLQEME